MQRNLSLAPKDRPTQEAFLNSLTEKYGIPTNTFSTSVFLWAFDDDGKLRRAADYRDADGSCAGYLRISVAPGRDVVPSNIELEKCSKNCGASLLTIVINYVAGVGLPTKDTLVRDRKSVV